VLIHRQGAKAAKFREVYFLEKNMYCPNCGTQASADQKFCRSCGLNLQAISQMLTGQRPAAEPSIALVEIVERFQSHRQKMLRWGFITLWIGITVAAFLGIVGGSLTSINWDLGQLIASLAGLGGLILLVGIGLMIYSRFLPRVPAYRPSPQPTALPQAESRMGLPPKRYTEPVPSVTEQTTVKLEAPPETAQEPNE